MDPHRINPPELFTRAHKRIPSLSPTRSPTRQRITDDILSDLSPTTTLEAFTNPSGKLRASIEAATPSERAFGIRATLASKKIQEWVEELSAWSWPAGEGSAGFEAPAAKRRRISADERAPRAGYQDGAAGEEEYIGSLPAEDVARYENRVDDIHEDMDDLNVEEIKSTVLNTHFSPKSRPSSSGSNAPVPSLFSSFTRMDDLTAVVTATVLQALPNLSKLTRLMDIWTVRLLVLRKVPPLLLALDDAEVALRSGWQAIEVPRRSHNGTNGIGEEDVLGRKTFEIMRNVLQDKVTRLGQDLDYMLDTLEGRQDTLPEVWLDRMETIERDYGEWVVRADRKVREGEWAQMAKARKAETDRIRAEEEAKEAVRLQAEKEQRKMEEKLRLEQEKAAQLERERKEAEEKLRLEQEAAAEAARQIELARKQEEDRIKAEEEAARLETERQEREEMLRLEREAAAESARLEALARKREEDRIKAGEAARVEAERVRLEQETVSESARLAELELARKEQDRLRAEEATCLAVERQRVEDEQRMRLEQEAAAESARLKALAQKQEEDRMKAEQVARVEAERVRLEQEAAAESARLADLEVARKEEEDRLKAEVEAREEAERQRIELEEQIRLEREAAAEMARQAERARKQEEEDALKLKVRQAADAEAAQIEAETVSKEKELELKLEEEQALEATELAHQHSLKKCEEADLSKERDGPTPHSPVQAVDPKMISTGTVSALALGMGAAVTSTVLRAGNGEDPEPAGLFQQDASHVSPPIGPDHEAALVTSRSPDPGMEGSANIAFEELQAPALAPSTPFAKLPPLDGYDDSKIEDDVYTTASSSADTHAPNYQDGQIVSVVSWLEKPPASQRPETPATGSYSERPSSPRTPSTSSGPVTPVALTFSSATSKDGTPRDGKSSPSSPSKIARFGHGVAKMLRRASSPKVPSNVRPQSSGSQPRSPVPALPMESPRTPTKAVMLESLPSTPPRSSLMSDAPPLPLRSPAREQIDQEWIVVEPSREDDAHSPKGHADSTESSDIDDKSSRKVHNRNISLLSGYSTSDPTPEILEAEPAEYFRPILSPMKIARSTAETNQRTSPSKSPLFLSSDGNVEETPLIQVGTDSTWKPSAQLEVEEPAENSMNSHTLEEFRKPAAEFDVEETPANTMTSHNLEKLTTRRSDSDVGSDGAQESAPRTSEEIELGHITPPVLARKTSIARINSPIRRIEIPRRGSTASDTSTVMHRQPGDVPSSPLSPPSPLSERVVGALPEADEESPLKGRFRSRVEEPADRSPSSSPPPIPAMSPRRSFHLPKSPSFSKTEHEDRDAPSTPSEAPVFDNVDLSEASIWSSPKKSTDDQIQAQISSLLESIPARIRLTSEPPDNTTTFVPPEGLRPIKARRSITPSFRSYSSLSSRAPTPSFTLAPAYGKGTSRPRPQNGNPEIKLYHLSRSTGEAPIKLFVRLVGENGERVMVRVGGGWADLGEYLREYASHHGRRSNVDSDKVEVQNIRPRVVSNSSTASTATIRGNNGRSSPVSRPGSAFDRPMSALHIRKTRKSVGESDSSTMTLRTPSTPLPMTNRGRDFETPPLETSRSVSRLSWTEEDGGLGLAGPKAKKVAISEKDQEWVESMKEKVRLASAEKEKKEKAKERKSFGEMDKVGGTKRLFRKG